MMIAKNKNSWFAECQDCDFRLADYDARDLGGMVTSAKEDDWQVGPEILCPACRPREKRELLQRANELREYLVKEQP